MLLSNLQTLFRFHQVFHDVLSLFLYNPGVKHPTASSEICILRGSTRVTLKPTKDEFRTPQTDSGPGQSPEGTMD